jgi:hypothetical protein
MRKMELTTQYEYLAAIQTAKLGSKEKLLLYFYATTFNWKESRPSFYGQRKICALNSMGQGAYDLARDKLEELGWIKVLYRGRKKSCQVTVMYGKDDPSYERRHWAKWHPDNVSAEDEFWELVSKLDQQGVPIDALLEFADTPEEGIAFAKGIQ